MAAASSSTDSTQTSAALLSGLQTIKGAEAKQAVARICLALSNDGWSQKQCRELLARAGYQVKEPTLRNWLSQLNQSGAVGIVHKRSGRKNRLSLYQRLVMCGYILQCNDEGVLVGLKDYVSVCHTIFEESIDKSTACRYLAKDGFKLKKAKRRTGGYKHNTSALEAILWNWIKLRTEEGVFKAPRSRLCSIDFTYTSHRTNSQKSYAPSGQAQPVSTKGVPSYTNCLITCIWQDGANRTPSVLFTFNPKFRTDRATTRKRTEDREHLERCCDEFGIAEHRLIYIGAAKYEKRKYVAESSDLIRRFFSAYGVREHTTVFSDKGHAFSENGVDVLVDLGFKNHKTYPPPVHHFLSPNDNELHATAKQQWRELCSDFEDDVRSCCQLMHFLDKQTTAHSAAWFRRNITKLKEEDVVQLVRRGSAEQQRWNEHCKNLYHLSQGRDIRKDQFKIPKELQDTLDGPYYRT